MSKVDDLIGVLRGVLGTPYTYGGEDPLNGGSDCSGLMQWGFARVGVSLPRTAAEQQKASTRVNNPVPGDLVFYGPWGSAHHVGLYIGGGKMIAAPHTGDVVKVQDVYKASDGPSYGRITGLGSAASNALDVMTLGVGSTLSSALTSVTTGARSTFVTVLFAGAGLVLVAAGVAKAASPAIRRRTDTMKEMITP